VCAAKERNLKRDEPGWDCEEAREYYQQKAMQKELSEMVDQFGMK